MPDDIVLAVMQEDIDHDAAGVAQLVDGGHVATPQARWSVQDKRLAFVAYAAEGGAVMQQPFKTGQVGFVGE